MTYIPVDPRHTKRLHTLLYHYTKSMTTQKVDKNYQQKVDQCPQQKVDKLPEVDKYYQKLTDMTAINPVDFGAWVIHVYIYMYIHQ